MPIYPGRQLLISPGLAEPLPRPGFPAPSASSSEAEALLETIHEWIPTLCKFERSGASTGPGREDLYDLVALALPGNGNGSGESKKYLSLDPDGAICLRLDFIPIYHDRLLGWL